MTTQRLQVEIKMLLAQSQQGVISTKGESGFWAVPALYRRQALTLFCLLPRWADATFHLTQNPNVMLTITQTAKMPAWFIQVRGIATPSTNPNWGIWQATIHLDLPEARYTEVALTPQEIELVDERTGWSRRELLRL